jgi:hypothetical protein
MRIHPIVATIVVAILLTVSIQVIMFIRSKGDKSLATQLADLQALNDALKMDILRLSRDADGKIISPSLPNTSLNIANELSAVESNPLVPYTLDIVIPTLPRAKNGYAYLTESVTAHIRTFTAMNTDVNIYAYSRSEVVPPIHHKRFHFKTITPIVLTKDKMPAQRPNYIRYDPVLKQNLDWVTMMAEYKKICKPNQVFLYMEDDFTPCRHADTHIMSVYHWALKHRSEWKSIRMTFGFSGLLLQCDDLDEYLKYVWERFLSPLHPIYPIDYGLAEYWTQYDWEPGKRVHHTFRYNLFDHNGAISTVENDDEKPFNPKCWDGMSHSFNYHYEKFDTFYCQHYLFSPCQKPEIQRELEYHGGDTIKSRSILKGVDKKLMEMKLGVHLVEAQVTVESCDTVCDAKGLKCFAVAYCLANSCEEMRARWKCRYDKCMNQVWSAWKPIAPFMYESGCVVIDDPAWTCSAKWRFDGDAHKICPCSKVVPDLPPDHFA